MLRIGSNLLIFLASSFLGGCADDGSVEADRKGVGAQCTRNEDCLQEGDCNGVPCIQQVCLTQFKGGYCGVLGCKANAECPEGSACVAHDDGKNYCFRACASKSECNVNRSEENESNCSSTAVLVEANTKTKACVPPSGK